MAATTQELNINISTRKAKRLIMSSFEAGLVPFLWGGPGIGKSDLIREIGRQTGRPVIDMRLLLLEPTDLKGIPYYNPVTNTMKWAPVGELPQPGDVSLENAILFLDELNAANPAVQGAAFQLILDRRIGEYVLPEGVSMVAAGNRLTDGGAAHRMLSPLANRLAHFHLETNFDDWFEWGANNKIHPEILGYLQQHRANLNTFANSKGHLAFATQRSWAKFSKWLSLPYNHADDEIEIMCAANVGYGVAVEYMAHRQHVQGLPSPEDVLFGKVTTLEAKEISAKYSLIISLAYALADYEKLQGATVTKEDDASQLPNALNEYLRNKKVKIFNEKEFNSLVDVFLTYVMLSDNFQKEMKILGLRILLCNFNVKVDVHGQVVREVTKQFGHLINDKGE